MKKAIVLGAAMLLAGAAVFAAEEKKGPAVKFSGYFRAGYTFKFYDGDFSSTSWKGKTEERVNMHVKDADGLWDVNIKSLSSLDGDDKIAGGATVSLSKALEKNGLDLNGLSLKFSIGNKTNDAMLRAYDNASGDDFDKYRLVGDYVTAFTVGYDKLTVQIASDPITDNNNNAGVAVSAKYADSDLGFAVAAGYAHKGAGWTDDGDVANSEGLTFASSAAKTDGAILLTDNGLAVSGNVDIAKLIKADKFKLGAGVAFNYGFGDGKVKSYFGGATESTVKGDLTTMRLVADVSGGIDIIDGFVEYAYEMADSDDLHMDKIANQYLKAQANLNFFADKGIGLDVYFKDTDLDDFSDYWLVGGDVNYKLGGVKYTLKAEAFNVHTASDDKVAFTLSPRVRIDW